MCKLPLVKLDDDFLTCMVESCTKRYIRLLPCGHKVIPLCGSHFRQWRRCNQGVLTREFLHA